MIFGHLSQIAIFIAMCATAVLFFLIGLLLSRASDRNKIERLRSAIAAILSDHDERVALYGAMQTQPHRVDVMEAARTALAEKD